MVTARDLGAEPPLQAWPDGPGRPALRRLQPGAGPAGVPVAATLPCHPALLYWQRMRRWTLLLLLAWLAVTLAVPWFAVELNQLSVAHFPLGYWMSSQGAVGVYLLLIGAYVVVAERLEDALQQARQQAGRQPDAGPDSVSAAPGR